MDTHVSISLPRLVPVQQDRAPQVNIPQTLIERSRLKALARAYVDEARPVPPLTADDLRAHAAALLARAGAPEL